MLYARAIRNATTSSRLQLAALCLIIAFASGCDVDNPQMPTGGTSPDPAPATTSTGTTTSSAGTSITLKITHSCVNHDRPGESSLLCVFVSPDFTDHEPDFIERVRSSNVTIEADRGNGRVFEGTTSLTKPIEPFNGQWEVKVRIDQIGDYILRVKSIVDEDGEFVKFNTVVSSVTVGSQNTCD